MTKKLAYLSKRYEAPAGTIDRLLSLREKGFKPILLRGKESITAGFGVTKPLSDEEIQARVDKVASRGRFNIGIMTGKRGGVFVIDEDTKGDFAKFCASCGIEEPNCPVVQTPSGGNHYYFRYTDDLEEVVQKVKFFGDLDIRTNGGYISAWGNTYPGCQNEELGDNCDCSKCQKINRPYTLLDDERDIHLDSLPELPVELKKKLPRKAKAKRTLKIKEVINPEDHGFYENIFLQLLDVKRSSQTEYWSKAVPMMVNLGLSSELIHAFSRRTDSGNYDESAVDRYIASFDPSKNPPSMGTLKLWLEEDIGKEKTKELLGQREMVSRIQFELLYYQDKQWASLFLEENISNYILTYDDLIWYFDPETKLWVRLQGNTFMLPISDWGEKYLKDKFDGALDHFPGYRVTESKFTSSKGIAGIDRYVKARFNQIMEKSGLNKGYCFPIAGGKVLDFDQSLIRERTKKDFLNFESPCSLDRIPTEAELSLGKKYLLDLCCGDSDLCRHLEEIIGCCLIGSNVAKIVVMFTGRADAGKSTLINLLEYIAPKAIGVCDKTVLLESKREKAGDPELLKTINRRAIITHELALTDTPSPSKIKSIVGGDKLEARRNHSNDMIEFECYATPIMLTNVIPNMSTEPSFINKVQVIPFRASFQKSEKFKQELFSSLVPRDVLVLAMLGFQRLKNRNFEFQVPEASKIKKDDMIDTNESNVETFVKKYKTDNPNNWTSISVLYQRYYSDNEGVDVLGKIMFSKQLVHLGCERKVKTGNVKGFTCFNILPN